MGGEAGVGKTRLAEEFLAARRRGRCDRAGRRLRRRGGGRAAARRRSSRRCATTRGLDDAGGAARAGGAELARLLPDLVEPPPGRRRRSRLAQARLFELALGLLGRLAAERPLVLVLEDLHWSDRSTRDLLAFLVRNLRAERIVIVATYRSDELYRGHPLRPFLAELDRGRAGDPAGPAPVHPRRAGRAPRGLLGARRSGRGRIGLRALAGQRVLRRGAGEHRGRAAALPPMLHDILLVRIESRSAAAQELLRVVAAGGARVPERLLAAVSRCPTTSARRRCARPSSTACWCRRARTSTRSATRCCARPSTRSCCRASATGCTRRAARRWRRIRSWPAGGRGRRRPRAPLVRGARPAARARRVGRGRPGGRAALGLRRGPRALRARARAVGAAWPTPRRARASISWR